MTDTASIMSTGEKAASSIRNESKRESLLGTASELAQSLRFFNEINHRANIISLNAAIEGARMRTRFPSFSIVANQIQAQANKNIELSERLEILIKKILSVSLKAAAARYYELSEDLIDKLDRNLFERNCDVQAWATFESIRSCSKSYMSKDLEKLNPELLRQDKVSMECQSVLEKLVDTYVVYSDILLINPSGIIINSAKNPHLLGTLIGKETWFDVSLSGAVHVSDVRLCPLINALTVSYSSPVLGDQGEVIGVVSTRFNWKFGQEMIDSFPLNEKERAYFCNQESLVLGASAGLGVMCDHLFWSDAGRETSMGKCGFSIESDRNGSPIAVGFSRTKGYNAYRGKKWSSIIVSRIEGQGYDNQLFLVDERTDALPLGEKQISDLIQSEIANEALKETMVEVKALVDQINRNNREAKFLAINASIQSGIAGEEGDGFAIIAQEIGQLARKSLNFVSEVNKISKSLTNVVQNTVTNRIVDAAKDAIDKVDRNLFERYCDVQAWTTFQLFKQAVTDPSVCDAACELASKLHKIYEVYHEVLLCDLSGKVVACATDRRLIGKDLSNRDWFSASREGKVHYTDLYISDTINQPTVTFSAPLTDESGNVIGVLSTRFNCNFLNDILKAVIRDSKSEVLLVNSEGVVISTQDGRDVLKRRFPELDVYQKSNKNWSGLRSMHETTTPVDFGFAKGRGYNTYQGNHWTILIQRQEEQAVATNPSVELTLRKAA